MITVKFVLISILLQAGGVVENSYSTKWPGFEAKSFASIEECEYLKYQNFFTSVSSPLIGQVVQVCVPVEERAA